MRTDSLASDLFLEHFGLAEPLSGTEETTRFCFGFPQTDAVCPPARYTTLEAGDVLTLSSDEKNQLTKAISVLLRQYLQGANRILICGIGNPDLTADSLGPAVCTRLPAVDSLPAVCHRRFFSLIPGTSARTGLPTARLLYAAATCADADRILVIDALRAKSAARLSTVLQLSDLGLTPGSGICDKMSDAEEISGRTMPCPVVSMGVPTVIRTRLPEGGEREYLVTHSLADSLIRQWSSVLSAAILRCMLSE